MTQEGEDYELKDDELEASGQTAQIEEFIEFDVEPQDAYRN